MDKLDYFKFQGNFRIKLGQDIACEINFSCNENIQERLYFPLIATLKTIVILVQIQSEIDFEGGK